MTASSITLRPRATYRSPADRLAVSIGAALVTWANRRAARATVTHERRATAIEHELALIERERIAFRIHEFH
jgi:hypothetical protein